MTNSVIAPSASIIWRLATTYRVDPAPLFAQAGLDASMWIFRHDPDYVFGADMAKIATTMHGLKTDEMLRLQFALLMNSINAWLAGSDLADTSRVARIAALLAGQQTRLCSINEQD